MTDTVSISKKAYAAVMLQLKNAYPYEDCGVLLSSKKSGVIESVGSIDNTAAAEKRASHYMIDPLTLYKLETEAEKNDMEVAGFYHSHPDKAAIPSKEDMQYMIPGMLYMIVSTLRYGVGEIKGYIKDDPDGKASGVAIWEV